MSRRPPATILLGALAFLAAGGCGDSPEPPVAEPAPGPPLRPVVAAAVARLEAELAPVPALPDETPAAELVERVRGLVATLASSQERLRRFALEDLAGAGPPSVGVLAGLLDQRSAEPAERMAAADALAAVDTPLAAEVLLARLELPRSEVDPEGWLRAACAEALGRTGQDQCVPRLLLSLRYELDYPTATSIAGTLGRFANFAGLDALEVVAREGATADVRERAEAVRARLAADAGFAGPAELARAWAEGDPALPPDAPSARHRLALWRRIAALAEWQLRGVDDARFVLSREGGSTARFLAEALSDENVYVRVHSAQCLERMGPRGAVAGEALVRALDDPELAPQAALALGAVRFGGARPALERRLDAGTPLGLRVACAQALGGLGDSRAVPALVPLLDGSEPLELRVAAAGSLARCAPLDALGAATRLLREHLTSGRVEATGPEAALGAWLLRRAESEPGVAEALERWRALGSEPEAERLRGRARLLEELAGR